MNSDRAKWLVLPSVLVLVACVHDGQGRPPASTFGEANRQTMMAQVVDPEPEYDSVVPAASAAKAAQATERYRKDNVKKPERVRSTAVSGGSSSTGSGTNP